MYLGDFVKLCGKNEKLEICTGDAGRYNHVATIKQNELIALLKVFDSERAIDYAKPEIVSVCSIEGKIVVVVKRRHDER